MRRAIAHRASSLGWLTLVLCWFAVACVSESPTDLTLPVSLQIVSGDNQQAIVGHELPSPLVVQVLDAKGKPVGGQVVNFRVVTGGGSVYAGASLTNKDGFAQDYWTMGPEPGLGTLEVRAVDPTTGAKQNFAMFTATVIETFTLVVSVDGSGTVTGSGIDCPGTCSADYLSGTVVVLSASASAGIVFQGWTGDCTGTGTCTVSMTANRTVTATFPQQSFELVVSVTGTGTVTSPLSRICPFDCVEVLPSGTNVTLAPTPGVAWVFAGWSGDCTGATCSLTMDGPRVVQASFAVAPCPGGGQPISHDNGVPAETYLHCNPRGVPGDPSTYTESMAMAAAQSWDVSFASISPRFCASVPPSPPDAVVAVRPGTLVELIWIYRGPLAGRVNVFPHFSQCPDGASGTWN